MSPQKFCTYGDTAALKYAASTLWSYGWEYDASARVILLPVPSFDQDGRVKGGGRIEDVLTCDSVVFGGNLNHKGLSEHKCIDLLQDPFYLAENASITAHCAVKLVLDQLDATIQHCPILILGWGRIGKCLSYLLKRMHAIPTVYARNPEDRAILEALGYRTIGNLADYAIKQKFRVIINTVPQLMLTRNMTSNKQIKIDLASVRGIEGNDVLWARGLPNSNAPESSGILIAQTVDRIGKELYL